MPKLMIYPLNNINNIAHVYSENSIILCSYYINYAGNIIFLGTYTYILNLNFWKYHALRLRSRNLKLSETNILINSPKPESLMLGENFEFWKCPIILQTSPSSHRWFYWFTRKNNFWSTKKQTSTERKLLTVRDTHQSQTQKFSRKCSILKIVWYILHEFFQVVS